MKRILVCHIVPNHLTHKLKASQAANNFCLNLLQTEVVNSIISLVPFNIYSKEIKNEKRIIYYQRFKYTNVISKLLSYIIRSIQMAFKIKRYDSIWFYNIFDISILTYILLKFIFLKKVYVIMTDYTPSKSKISKQNFIKYLIEASNGLICLSERSQFKHKNCEYIPGIIPSNKIIFNSTSLKKPLKVLFSGTLSEVTGFPLAIKVFSQLPNISLYVSGNGIKPKNIDDFPNIHYLGMLSIENYQNLLSECDICLNFRNPQLPENINNFPSKLLEYLSYNKIVISTMFYPELKQLKYIELPYNEEEIIAWFNNNFNNERLLSQYVNNGEIMKELISEVAWIRKMKKIEEYTN